MFGEIDLVAAEHRLAAGFDASRLGEFTQKTHGLGIDRAFGPVEQQVAVGPRKGGETPGVGGEGGAHVGGCAAVLLAERTERGVEGSVCHGFSPDSAWASLR